MKHNTLLHLLFLATLAALSSCADDNAAPAPARKHTGVAMRFGVAGLGREAQTRTLLETNQQLQDACDVTRGGEAIGFWVDYVDYDEVARGNVAGGVDKNHLGNNQQLKYYPEQPEALRWDFDATASSESRFWLNTGHYLVRAFYPRSLHDQIVPASTDALLLTMTYNTHRHQHDLMMAGNEVVIDDYACHDGTSSIALNWNEDGTDVVESDIAPHATNPYKYGYSQSFALSDPVPLKFRHALAAVQIRFMFDMDVEDELLGVEFVNQDDNGLHTQGAMLFGDPTETYGVPTTPTLAAREQINWNSYPTEVAGRPFYRWMIDTEQTADGKGALISRTTVEEDGQPQGRHHVAIAFAQRNHYYAMQCPKGDEPTATFTWHEGDKDLPVRPDVGAPGQPQYNENDGWLLLIPQPMLGGSRIRAYFKNTYMLELDMPSVTGTLADGTPSASGNYLAPGHKYIYTILIKGTDVLCTVQSGPWDEWWSDETFEF